MAKDLNLLLEKYKFNLSQLENYTNNNNLNYENIVYYNSRKDIYRIIISDLECLQVNKEKII